MQRGFLLTRILVCSLLAIAPAAVCQQNGPLTLAVTPSAPGLEIPSDFLGVSLETETMLANAQGQYPMFRASNQPLIQLFHTLGIRSLRIGGNTADLPDIRLPNNRDIDELFTFSRQADVQVIYTLRLRDWTPDKDVAPAKYVMSHYAPQISCIAIGNEPDVYEKEFAKYAHDVAGFFSVIGAAVPNAKFCGPGTSGNPRWVAEFAQSFAKTTPIEWLTQHMYPASRGNSKADLAAARLELLSPEVMQRSAAAYAAFGPEARAAGLKYRLEETNSDYRMAGVEGVSDSFASALWALDYMYWWAAHAAQGVNFHTGDTVAVKGGDGQCIYAVYRTAGRGYDVRPLGYAMKAFDLTGRGRLLPVAGPSIPDVSTYAVAGRDGDLYFTLISKARSNQAQPVHIQLNPGPGFVPAGTMLLTSPEANLASTTGITLGGAKIEQNGQWHGHWSALEHGSKGEVTLMPDTALLVRFRPSK
jgi:hypothetical protein